MFWTALKMLTGDRAKYLGIIFGVTFAAMLIAQQLSIFCGIMLLMTATIRDVEGVDLWVMDRDVSSIDDFKPIADTMVYRVRSIPGVRWAVPFYRNPIQVRLAARDGGAAEDPGPNISYETVLGVRFQQVRSQANVFQSVLLLGVDDSTLIGAPRPENILIGSLDRIRRPDAVLVDKYSCELLWPDEAGQLKGVKDYERFVGRTFEVNDHKAVIVGICRASPNFQTLPVVYATYNRVRQFLTGQQKITPYILVKADPGVPLEQVSRDIAARTDHRVKARSREDFIWDTVWYNLRRTGIAINFGITVMLGFVVGTAIAGQTFYQFAMENLKQFGALKAMGTSNRSILSMILLQAMVVGPIGYSLGVGLAALFGTVFRDDPKAAFFMPWQVLLITGVAITLICLLSSLLSIRRVLVVEPAIVFR